MFGKFNQDFNRPSEYAIKFGGASPAEEVWTSQKAREMKASVSMVEGTNRVEVIEIRPKDAMRPKEITLKIKQQTPFILTVRDLHPKYFDKIRERHDVRLTRLRRLRRKGFRVS